MTTVTLPLPIHNTSTALDSESRLIKEIKGSGNNCSSGKYRTIDIFTNIAN